MAVSRNSSYRSWALGRSIGNGTAQVSRLARTTEPKSGGSVEGRLPLLTYRNILVVIDHGQMTPAQYFAIVAIAQETARAYPAGLGCMVIIPPTSRPPPENVRRAIKSSLDRATQHLRCLCWMVDGVGFRAATIRAALAGLGLLIRASYPTSVASTLQEGLQWTFGHLDSTARPSEILEAVTSIERQRLAFDAEHLPVA